MKKLIAILCAAALTLSLAACGSTAEDYAGQTLTGQVTAIDGSAVTLQLGELTEDTNTPPDGSSDAQTPPEKPGDASGSDTQAPPDGGSAPSGQAPDGGSDTTTPPEKPDGGSGSDTANTQPPAKPDDASGDANDAPPDLPSGGPGGSTFTAGDETVTLDFFSAEITENGETVSLSDRSEGDVVTATVGSGTAVSDNAVITIESGCTWTLTGDCVITSLTNNGTIRFNGYTITLADGTVLRG